MNTDDNLPFPSLVWPIGSGNPLEYPVTLKNKSQMLSFVLLWSVSIHGTLFFIRGVWAAIAAWRRGKKNKIAPMALIPLFFGIGLATGALTGSLVGLLLGFVYDSAGFFMATWVPLSWGIVQAMVVVTASFPEISLNVL